MCVTYLTGTRNPGDALLRFLPDFIDVLLDQGAELITSNKRGVDEAVITHCEQHDLPLKVCAFLGGHNFHKHRHVEVQAGNVSVQKIYSPTWLRFRHLADLTEKMIFLHAAKTRGKCQSMTTLDAFAAACQKRGVQAEQWIIQKQAKRWTQHSQLRTSPIVGAAHLYLYARPVSSIGGDRYALAYYRLETWRKLGEVVQPGIGRREFIVPNASQLQATLEALHHALQELQAAPPSRLIIHHSLSNLEKAPSTHCRVYPEIRRQVRKILSHFPQVLWHLEAQPEIMARIGAHIQEQQTLWDHKRMMENSRGLNP